MGSHLSQLGHVAHTHCHRPQEKLLEERRELEQVYTYFSEKFDAKKPLGIYLSLTDFLTNFAKIVSQGPPGSLMKGSSFDLATLSPSLSGAF